MKNVPIGPATIVGYALAAAGIALSLIEGDTDFAKWGAAIAAFTGAGRQAQAAAKEHGAAVAGASLLPTDEEELAAGPPPIPAEALASVPPE